VPNGIVYVVWAFSSGHFAKFFPLRPRDIFHDLVAALRFRLPHEKGVYNAVQKLLYLCVLLAGVVIVVSGLAIWKPVQLWFFCDLCGGYFAARYVHFFAMAVIMAFIFVHVVMVALVPKTLPAMILGGEEQNNET
jgi:thiosulfate reductase cytochrome b subunit